MYAWSVLQITITLELQDPVARLLKSQVVEVPENHNYT
jgi:hypothetical protein